MASSGNICVKKNNDDPGVFLYQHWDGYDLPKKLSNALKMYKQWDDVNYLTRVIFECMTEDSYNRVLGYGISSSNIYSVKTIYVYCNERLIVCNDNSLSFNSFLKLNDNELKEFFY